jgi:hypothetical protein
VGPANFSFIISFFGFLPTFGSQNRIFEKELRRGDKFIKFVGIPLVVINLVQVSTG